MVVVGSLSRSITSTSLVMVRIPVLGLISLLLSGSYVQLKGCWLPPKYARRASTMASVLCVRAPKSQVFPSIIRELSKDDSVVIENSVENSYIVTSLILDCPVSSTYTHVYIHTCVYIIICTHILYILYIHTCVFLLVPYPRAGETANEPREQLCSCLSIQEDAGSKAINPQVLWGNFQYILVFIFISRNFM